MLTAVWMHLDEAQRQLAMSNISTLVRNGGIVIMSLRHGPIPPGRRMFEVPLQETRTLAQRAEPLLHPLNREAEPSLLGNRGSVGHVWHFKRHPPARDELITA